MLKALMWSLDVILQASSMVVKWVRENLVSVGKNPENS